MKKLKQEQLFSKLKSLKISVKQYLHLYLFYQGTADVKIVNEIPEIYKTPDGKINDKGIAILVQIDSLFATKKNLKDEEVLGSNYIEYINKYNNLFPTGKLPSGVRGRSTIVELKKKFIWFFSNYNYSWDLVLKATARYLDEYEAKNFFQMRNALYFVQKTVNGELHCDLANYCEDCLENKTAANIEPKFKTNVID